jgi:hypothetical protein
MKGSQTSELRQLSPVDRLRENEHVSMARAFTPG